MDQSCDRLYPPSSPHETLNRTRRPPEQENPNLLRPPPNTPAGPSRARRPPTPNDSMCDFQPNANSTKIFNSRYLREASQGEFDSPDLSALLNDTSIAPDSACNLSQVTQPSIFRSGFTPSKLPADVSLMPFAAVNQAAAQGSFDQSHPAYDYVNDSVCERQNHSQSIQPSIFRSGFTPSRIHVNDSVSPEVCERQNNSQSNQPSIFRSGFTPSRHLSADMSLRPMAVMHESQAARSGYNIFEASDRAGIELGDSTFDDDSETMVIDGPKWGPWKLAVMFAPKKTNEVVSYDLHNMILAELEKRREAAFQNVSAAGYNRFSPTGASSFRNEH